MGQGKNYTKEEDAYIIKQITDNPGNIQEVCKQIGLKLNRPHTGIVSRWYTISNENPEKYNKKGRKPVKLQTNKTFMLVGKKNHSLNRKNTNNSIKHSKQTIWKKLVKFFTNGD